MQNDLNRKDAGADGDPKADEGGAGLLIPDIAHEIRNLMQSVQGLAELELRHGQKAASSARLQKISEQAQLAAELASALLRVSKPVADKPSGDVAEAIQTAVNLFASTFGQGIDLQCNMDCAIPAVALPTGFVELILLNLSQNAADAVRGIPNPAVRISAHRENGHAVIRFWNNGPPIAAGMIGRIFESGVTTKSACSGHGLGLNVVRKLAERAGGSVAVENMASGGVQFQVTLPCHQNRPKTVFTVVRASDTALAGRRILVVDDDPSVREVLTLMIKDLGGSVHTCSSGQEALGLNDANFDVVLLDLRMNGLSGQETFEHMLPELQRKVVFVTGEVVTAPTRQFVDGAIRPILTKPVSFSQLCGIVPQKAG